MKTRLFYILAALILIGIPLVIFLLTPRETIVKKPSAVRHKLGSTQLPKTNDTLKRDTSKIACSISIPESIPVNKHKTHRHVRTDSERNQLRRMLHGRDSLFSRRAIIDHYADTDSIKRLRDIWLKRRSAAINAALAADGSKYGILGYSYPPTITVGSSKTIHAFISIKFPESKVRDTLLVIVADDDKTQTGDSIVIVKPIRLFKEVTMTLDCMDTILKVTPDHPSAKQGIDTLKGNKWSWSIYAKTADHPSSKLKLKITTEGPSSYEEKTLIINIKVEPHIIRKIYDYLINHPEVLVSSILIPVIGFFGARYFKKKRKKNNRGSGNP